MLNDQSLNEVNIVRGGARLGNPLLGVASRDD